jgi:hypothetical protein
VRFRELTRWGFGWLDPGRGKGRIRKIEGVEVFADARFRPYPPHNSPPLLTPLKRIQHLIKAIPRPPLCVLALAGGAGGCGAVEGETGGREEKVLCVVVCSAADYWEGG